VFSLIRANGIDLRRLPPETPPEEPLFREAIATQLAGEVLIANTIPSGYSVNLPLQSFGQRAHVLVAGATGTGKSTLLNWIFVQLTRLGIPVLSYDTLNQSAPALLPLLPSEQLGILTMKDYRRNLLLGPKGMSQIEWLRVAADHFIDSFGLEPVTFNVLMQVVEGIVASGAIASIPKVIAKLGTPGHKTQSHVALLNRLLPLTLSGEQTFTAECGFDPMQLFERSFVFYLKSASERVRRIIYSDHYCFLSQSRSVLNTWQLHNVVFFHEANALATKTAATLKTMLTQARNYGIGFVFADQVPNMQQDPVVRGSLGTKILLRLEDAASVEMFRTALALQQEHKSAIMTLSDQQAIVRLPHIAHPFLAKIPNLYEGRNGFGTDIRFTRFADVTAMENRRKITLDWMRELDTPVVPKSPRTEDHKRIEVAPQLLGYLRLIAGTPGMKLTDRDASAGIAAGTGDRIRKRLLQLGLIEITAVNPGGQGASYRGLRLTLRGSEVLETSRKEG
jgi:hypothetical protein